MKRMLKCCRAAASKQYTRQRVLALAMKAGGVAVPVAAFVPSILSMKTMWEREDCSLSWVAPTERLSMAWVSRASTCTQHSLAQTLVLYGSGMQGARHRRTASRCRTRTQTH